MKKKVFTMIMAVLCTFAFAQAATYSGGDGSPATPYQISSAADWQTLSQTPADWASSFELTTGITVTNPTPVGTQGTPFSGTFDGGSNTITYNFNAQRAWVTSLFGYNAGTIENLVVNGTIEASEPFPALGSGWIGGIVAVNNNGGVVFDCTYAGTINLQNATSGDAVNNVSVGGIAAENNGTIEGSTFAGSIEGDVYNVYAGGIAGANYGTIDEAFVGGMGTYVYVGANYAFGPHELQTACGAIAGYNAGQVTESDIIPGVLVKSEARGGYIGGVVGFNEGSISDTATEATVIFNNYQGKVGGFAGWNYGTISESAAEADVTAGGNGNRIGGFVGVNSGSGGQGIITKSYFFGDIQCADNTDNVGLFAGTSSLGGNINNCYAIGKITSFPSKQLEGVIIGGFAAVNDTNSTITNSYAVDKEAKTNPPYYYGAQTFVGGAIGYKESGTITATIWNQTTSGLATGVGYGPTTGTLAKTTAQMKQQTTFTAEGWNFSSIWAMSDAGSKFEGYPIFLDDEPVEDTQTIQLNTGWNWISFNVLPANVSVASVLADYTPTNGDEIRSYTQSSTYYTGFGWFPATMTIEPEKMYKLFSTAGGSFDVVGTAVDINTVIPVVVGYNWIGYCPQENLPASTALQYYTPSNSDELRFYNEFSTYYDGWGWFPDMGMVQGRGYILKSLLGGDFSYGGAVMAPAGKKLGKNGAPDWTPQNVYPSTMTMSVYVTQGGDQIATHADSLISVWIDGDCVGVNINPPTTTPPPPVATGRTIFMVSPNGAEGKNMTFKVYDAATGEIYDVNESVPFVPDGNHGNALAPEELTVQAPATTYTVTFLAGDHGQITGGTAVQTVEEGQAAIAPEITADEGWTFTGWDTDFSNVTEPLTVTALYEQETFTVTFDLDGKGTRIGGGELEQIVAYGAAAAAPQVAVNAGWTFTGWSEDFSNITDDLTITALYEQETFTVTFDLDGKGTRIGGGELEQIVAYGAAAAAPQVAANAGWTFTGWDEDFSNITDDLVVTALYEQETFTVTFDLNGKGTRTGGGELEQIVAYGNAAASPQVAANAGWIFTGWDEDFSNITDDLVVTAQYEVQTFTVIFDLDGKGTRTGGGELEQIVAYGNAAVAPEVDADAGWIFNGWDKAFNNVTSNLTVKALYIEEGAPTYTVTFLAGEHGTITGGNAVQIVEEGHAAIAPEITPDAGWVFAGWDVPFDNITDDLDVTALYEVATFTVTFGAGEHGSIWSGDAEQEVEYGDSAVAPIIMPDYGWVLTGWEPDIDNITGNVSPVAQYEQIDMDSIDCAQADFNDDKVINWDDLSFLAENWLSYGDELVGDIDGNFWVNKWDYGILSRCWLQWLGGELCISLELGWNWISFNVLPEDKSVLSVLENYVPRDGDQIRSYTDFSTYYDGWGWFPDTFNFDGSQMYKLYSQGGGQLCVEGQYVPDDTHITVKPGYNWVGYPLKEDLPVSAALAYYGASDGDEIRFYNDFATYFAQGGYGWFPAEMLMKQGRGYVIKSAAGGDFSYVSELMQSTSKDSSKAAPVWTPQNIYPATMAMNVYITELATLTQIATGAGSLISVWIDGVCVGVNANPPMITPFGDVIFAVSPNGAAGKTMTFKVYDGVSDTIYDVIETVPFDPDENYGTAAAPLELTAIPVVPYIVTFDLDGKGTRIGGGTLVQTVNDGDDAVAPIVAADAGWNHYGWNRPFTSVNQDMTVFAAYYHDLPAGWVVPVPGANNMSVTPGRITVDNDPANDIVDLGAGDALIAYDNNGNIIGLVVNDGAPLGSKFIGGFPLAMTSNADGFAITYKYFNAAENEEYDIRVADASGAETFNDGNNLIGVVFAMFSGYDWYEANVPGAPIDSFVEDAVIAGRYVASAGAGGAGTYTAKDGGYISADSAAAIALGEFAVFNVGSNNCNNSTFLSFGLLDQATGQYHQLQQWQGSAITDGGVDVRISLDNFAGSNVSFYFAFSTGRVVNAGEMLWFENFRVE